MKIVFVFRGGGQLGNALKGIAGAGARDRDQKFIGTGTCQHRKPVTLFRKAT